MTLQKRLLPVLGCAWASKPSWDGIWVRAVPPACGSEIVIVENCEAYSSRSGELWGYVGPWKGSYFDEQATVLKAEYQQVLLDDASETDDEREAKNEGAAAGTPAAPAGRAGVPPLLVT